MIRDITIGQYYPTNSYIHRLDPRVKILSTFAYIISLFLIDNYIGYLIVALFIYTITKVAKIPLKFILKGLKAIFIIVLFTVILNVFMAPGETILYEFGKVKVTLEGIKLAIRMVSRLVLLIIGSSLMTLTTSPIELTDGIESLLKPFSKIGVPAHEIAMMMSISLRFIPILLEETDKIMKAQMARGADFESGGIIKRAKALIPILVPLFISAFRRADELAMAMEARCYRGGENRTRMKELRYESKDYIALSIMAILVVVTILI
ncbi:MAG: energy-coupling factor transporter transmembrane protein EcfT [Epulopiscium sp.]|nr:energy-coupling factor transporter transmembrane protein EcfT [Candidatus Epulonipiscium sp.]